MRKLIGVLIGFTLCNAPAAYSQTNDINRQNRTIEVVVSETVRVEPDIALVTLGCVSYGDTHDEAYQSNLDTSDRVIKALLDAGLSKDQIESNAIELNESNSIDDLSHPTQKGHKFVAHQSWNIRVKAADAQKIIDIAVQAGANGIENVSWDVSDMEVLEAKARAAAMKKARAIAEEIADSAGGKLGELLSASNEVNSVFLNTDRALQTVTVSESLSRSSSRPTFFLKLYPQKVEKQATVRAIFALD
ncbi:MAG TPA: SIMPL domain-containing protein [Candidatus Acidoferrales bacterium]|nr:SIMPL domain-containing protein [Candidatus Acidoferrales bacterium]